MKLDKKLKPETFVSKDTTRPHLTAVYFDAEAKQLAATDGHRMIVVPVADCAQDRTGYVSSEALKRARKLTTRIDSDAQLSANGVHTTIDGVSLPRPNIDGPFPPYQQILPSCTPRWEQDRRTVRIDAKYLASVFEAVGDRGVDITIGKELDPITFECESEHGKVTMVIMPMRR